MRKLTLLALSFCVALCLGLDAEAFAGQTSAAGSPTSGLQSPPTAQTVQSATQQGQTAHHATGKQAQEARSPAIPPGMRPLSLKEGRGIVQGMAWADDEEGLSPDCSHLVHTLYQQAGYPYPYTNSLDLYRGTGQFLRVRYAQPGDLAVWRGHVGIVLDPKEHTFFSSVTSGTRIENYRSPYWRARGFPRFYRYLTKSPLKSGGTTEAARTGLQPKEQAVLGGVESQPILQAVKAVPPASRPRGESVSSKMRDDASPETVTPAHHSSQATPSLILIRTGGKQPKAADVTSALEAANLEAGEMLRAVNLEKLERPIVVYRQLQISGVELKGTRGTAEIQIETVATLTPERMESQLGWEDHQLELQRTKKGWTMSPAGENVYVPRDGAMRVLAERLAALTQSTERSTEKDREQADIVRFMNLLVE